MIDSRRGDEREDRDFAPILRSISPFFLRSVPDPKGSVSAVRQMTGIRSLLAVGLHEVLASRYLLIRGMPYTWVGHLRMSLNKASAEYSPEGFDIGRLYRRD